MARDERAPHQEEIEALDAYWESLLNGAGPRVRPNTVVGGSDVIDGLYALDDTPPVDRSFAHLLEEKLMDQLQMAHDGGAAVGLAGVAPTIRCTLSIVQQIARQRCVDHHSDRLSRRPRCS